MQPGDVLLVDNYRVLHGRDVFNGDRFHAVSWFKEREGERRPDDADDEDGATASGNVLNKVINKVLVDSF
jgi:hypothetical protein